MRVLALGALWVPYIRDNWFSAIQHELGDKVLCINAGPLLASKEKYACQPEGFHCAYIYDLIRREKFDFLFFYHDWIFGDFPDAFFEKIRLAGIKTIAFHPDDEPEHWYARNSNYDHHFDVVASHSKAGTARRHSKGWGKKAMYLPWGFNDRTCYLIPDAIKLYDVVFIGKHKIDDIKGQMLIEDGAQREQILVRLAEHCQASGLIFKVFGHGWEQHPRLKKYAGGALSQEEMVRVYNETRVVFNPSWSSDDKPNAVQTKLRHFEVPGCGAFQITNENPELAELFLTDHEIVFYSTEEDLLKKINKYVADDSSRNTIAAAGYRRALNEHRLNLRVNALFEHINPLFPPTDNVHCKPSKVKRIIVKDRVALEKIQKEIGKNPNIFGDAEWIHFIGGKFENIDTNYAVLEPFFRNYPKDIMSVNTYFDFAGLANNAMQPKLVESNGNVLAEDVDMRNYDFPLLETRGGHFLGTSIQENACLLVNYVAPRFRAAELIDAYITNTVEAIHRMNPVSTGRITTELILAVPEGYEFTKLGIKNAEYVKRLRHLLPRLAAMKQRVVIYGISGMGEITLKLAEDTPGLELIGLVDRSLNMASFRSIPVLNPIQLNEVAPDVIILTSGSSGHSIYASISSLEGIICILPLYDLNHPVWSIVT
jgi:hypothetical protein